jgi:hypothetical protein
MNIVIRSFLFSIVPPCVVFLLDSMMKDKKKFYYYFRMFVYLFVVFLLINYFFPVKAEASEFNYPIEYLEENEEAVY